MERLNRTTENNQSLSSEDTLSSSTGQSEIRITTPSEQQLFRRITWLTLLLGIMFGCWLVLNVEVLCSNQLHLSVSTIIYLLGPLEWIPLGAACILLRRVQKLRRQYPYFQPGRFDFLDSVSGPFTSLSFGLLLIWMGSSQLIWEWLNLNPDMEFPVLITGVLMCVIGLFAELIVAFLQSRHTTQR
ncbi:hypothetical protein KSC_046260 [Ktedonobacter sp. SOSP1-52]|nr:hypothetical protein KSC_046260 [Ktedonobacter sp. SOSP1-52]